jgi:hypothetical protein
VVLSVAFPWKRRGLKIKKSEPFENVNFWPPFFYKELLISQNGNKKSTIIFHRQHDAMHIY